MKALLAGGGSYNPNGIFPISGEFDIVIAVDRGIHLLEELRVVPHYFFGDMDSNTFYSDDASYNCNDSELVIEKLNPDKDFTDMEYSLNRAIDLGIDSVTIIGAIGSRFDHSLTNINLLEKYKDKFEQIEITDGNNLIQPLQSPMMLRNKTTRTVSIIPSSDIKALSLSGFQYDLVKSDVKRASSLLNSNVVISDCATITFDEGEGVVVFADDSL